MGIRGFLSYIERDTGAFMVKHELASTPIIIDAQNFIGWLSQNPKLNKAFGGNYSLFFLECDKFAIRMQECSIRPIIIFDGRIDLETNKLEKIRAQRSERRVQSVINSSPGSNDCPNPIFLREIFAKCCRNYNFKIIQNDHKADNEIAALARDLDCPVLSSDSDFIIHGLKLITFNSMQMVPTEAKGRKSIACRILDIDKLLGMFHLNRCHLPLLLILLGDDYGGFQCFEKLCVIPRSRGNYMSFQKKLDAASRWLQRETFESAVRKIRSTVDEEKRDNITKLLGYYSTKIPVEACLLKNIVDKTDHLFLVRSKRDNVLPQWFVTASRQYWLPPWALRIALKHEFLFVPQVEKKEEPCSLLAALDILRGFAAVILSHDYPTISMTEKGGKCAEIIVQVREEEEIKDTIMHFYQEKGASVPNLKEIPDLPIKIRQEFLNKVLDLSRNELSVVDSLPRKIQLFVCAILYWHKRCKVSYDHIDALVSMLVIAGGKSLWPELKEHDCLIGRRRLEDLCNVSVSADKYDKRVVNSYSELQIVYLLTTYFNRLLQCPYEEPDAIRLYNGLFLHNVTVSEEWIETLHSAKSVYDIIIDITKLIHDIN